MDSDLLEKILDVSRRMAETRTLAPLLDDVVDEAIELTGAERGFIILTRADGTLDFRVKRDRHGRELQNGKDLVSGSVLTRVLDSSEPILSMDAMSDTRFSHAKSVANLRLRSIMCVPLIARGETIGAIYVENRSIRGRFDTEDLSPLTIFANQVAVSIENARLNDDLEERVVARTGELRQALTQLEEDWAQVVETNRARTAWMNDVVHDLRTGLTVVAGALSLLQMPALGELNDNQIETIAKADDAVEHTLNLINDLFDFTKLEAGGLVLHPEPVELPDFLRKVYEVGLGLSWPETVGFRLDIPDDLPEVWIDPVRIRQVLLNLLSNAHKFTDEGEVTLHARNLEDEAQILLGVADTGIGIAADKLDRLFERFFQQVDENRARQRTGSGLGLAISKALVELHGGRIWVESTPGVGSNFMLILPLHPPPAPDAADPA